MKFILFIFSLIFYTALFSQNFDPSSYPKGIYETFNDFSNKKPNQDPKLDMKSNKNETVFNFTNTETNKKTRKIFAISDGNTIYFDVMSLSKKIKENEKGQDPLFPGYAKSEKRGGYLLIKSAFGSSTSALGGVFGALAASRLKGIIYLEEKNIFDIFKNLKDFKSFMEEYHPNVVLDLEKTDENGNFIPEIEIVEKNLDKITQ